MKEGGEDLNISLNLFLFRIVPLRVQRHSKVSQVMYKFLSSLATALAVLFHAIKNTRRHADEAWTKTYPAAENQDTQGRTADEELAGDPGVPGREADAPAQAVRHGADAPGMG